MKVLKKSVSGNFWVWTSLRTLFCCTYDGSWKNHWDARIFLYTCVHKGWLVLIYRFSSTLVVLHYIVCEGKVFFVKRSAVHLDKMTMQKLCLFKENTWWTLAISLHMSDVLPQYFLSFLKGVVNVARFQLIHVQLGMPFKDMTMCGANNMIVPTWILNKESNNCVVAFVLASTPSCLFQTAIVVQDRFDEFISEFIWLTNYYMFMHFWKYLDLLSTVVLQYS